VSGSTPQEFYMKISVSISSSILIEFHIGYKKNSVSLVGIGKISRNSTIIITLVT